MPDNTLIEAFNSKLRSECVNTHWFMSLEDACGKPDQWRRHYNEERPHSAIGIIPPIMLANPTGATSLPDPGQAEKLKTPAVQGWVAVHKPADSRYDRGTNGGQVTDF